jgi:hypothetical protein
LGGILQEIATEGWTDIQSLKDKIKKFFLQKPLKKSLKKK